MQCVLRVAYTLPGGFQWKQPGSHWYFPSAVRESTRVAALQAARRIDPQATEEQIEPTRLDVINESHVHAGHRSSPGTGESHFRVLVMSPEFAGKSRVDRHRLVNDTLAAELKGQVHALAIQAYAPGEEMR